MVSAFGDELDEDAEEFLEFAVDGADRAEQLVGVGVEVDENHPAVDGTQRRESGDVGARPRELPMI